MAGLRSHFVPITRHFFEICRRHARDRQRNVANFSPDCAVDNSHGPKYILARTYLWRRVGVTCRRRRVGGAFQRGAAYVGDFVKKCAAPGSA